MSSRLVVPVLLLSCLTLIGCSKGVTKPANPPPDEVLVSMPTSGQITDYEDFIGRTEAIYSVEVRARVNGYLNTVNFKDGDEVEKGAVLFDIDDRPYRATFNNTMSMVDQSKARFTKTTADHRRAEALLARNAIGREEYDRIQGDYAESKATIGAVEATLAMAQLNLDWTKVTAPISGLLSRRMIDPGNLIKADETILTNIVSLDPIHVSFDIDERTLLKIRRLIAQGRVKSRREAELPVLIALADEPDFPHQGVINFSDNKIDPSTGTLRVRAILNNPKPRIFSPGLYCRVRLPIGTPHQSILVSEQAIGTDQGKKYVYVVEKTEIEDEKTKKKRDAQIVKYRPIQVGALANGMRVVNSGLVTGERVVVSGLQRVRPNKEVAPRMVTEFEKGQPSKVATNVVIPADVATARSSPTSPASAPAGATH